jgi:hypothetical protein
MEESNSCGSVNRRPRRVLTGRTDCMQLIGKTLTQRSVLGLTLGAAVHVLVNDLAFNSTASIWQYETSILFKELHANYLLLLLHLSWRHE